MKRLVLVLVTVVALLGVSAAPLLADDLPEAGTAAPGTYHDVAAVGGKAGALAQPPAEDVRLSKYAEKWIRSYEVKFRWGIVIYRCCTPRVPCTWAEMMSMYADGSPKPIQWLRLAQYLCIPGVGCTPWMKDWEFWAAYEEDTGFHIHAPGLDGGVGARAVGRFTFGYLMGGKPQTFDTYLVLTGWVLP